MKRMAVVLGLVALVGVFPTSAAAQARVRPGTGGAGSTVGQTTGNPQTPQERRQELQQLRQQLQRLQQQLRQHEAALRAARRDGDRTAAERENQAIRRLKTEIERVQNRIRLLTRGR